MRENHEFFPPEFVVFSKNIRKTAQYFYAGIPPLPRAYIWHRKGGSPLAYSDRELLARIVQCEAGGEGENGMKAVASVVMNRVVVDYGEYGRLHTLREVIFQKGQFTCAMETVGGQYNYQNLYNMRPTQVHFDIADWAMAGNRLWDLGLALWFYNPFSVTCRENFPSRVGRLALRLGNHCFYTPTEAYALT